MKVCSEVGDKIGGRGVRFILDFFYGGVSFVFIVFGFLNVWGFFLGRELFWRVR